MKIFVCNSHHEDIYTQPDSALLKDGKPFFMPDNLGDVSVQLAVVACIDRLGKSIAKRFAHRYYNEVSLGVQFGGSIEGVFAQVFDGAAVLGQSIAIDDLNASSTLRINDELCDTMSLTGIAEQIDSAIANISRHCILRQGDLLYFTSPAKRQINIHDHIEGYINNEKLLDFYVR